MGRDIWLTKNIIEQKLNNMVFEMILPITMKTNHQPDIGESRLYITILKTFLDYISKFEKELKHDREQIVSDVSKQKHEVEKESDVRKKIRLESKLRLVEKKLLSIDSEIGRFVGSVINTTIKVKGKEVSIFSDSVELVDEIKKVAMALGCSVVEEKNSIEAKKWLGRITSAS
jgi:hypothetical protein